jgi:hypothetical protein
MQVSDFVSAHAAELQTGRSPAHMVKPDAMGAAASYVEREYGYGYSLGIVSSSWTGCGLFEVCSSDGSRFRIYADRYGNVARVPELVSA